LLNGVYLSGKMRVKTIYYILIIIGNSIRLWQNQNTIHALAF